MKYETKIQTFVSRNTKVGMDVITARLQTTQTAVLELLLNSNHSIESITKVLDEMPSVDGSIDEGYLIANGIILI